MKITTSIEPREGGGWRWVVDTGNGLYLSKGLEMDRKKAEEVARDTAERKAEAAARHHEYEARQHLEIARALREEWGL